MPSSSHRDRLVATVVCYWSVPSYEEINLFRSTQHKWWVRTLLKTNSEIATTDVTVCVLHVCTHNKIAYIHEPDMVSRYVPTESRMASTTLKIVLYVASLAFRIGMQHILGT